MQPKKEQHHGIPEKARGQYDEAVKEGVPGRDRDQIRVHKETPKVKPRRDLLLIHEGPQRAGIMPEGCGP